VIELEETIGCGALIPPARVPKTVFTLAISIPTESKSMLLCDQPEIEEPSEAESVPGSVA
jgi:hypothetical protein